MLPSDRDLVKPAGRSTPAREALAGNAAELFAERGYARTSLRAVAARAGTDPALVRHYFGTKEKLFAEVVTATFRPTQVLAEALRRAGDPGAGRWLLNNVFADWQDPQQHRRIMGVLRSALDEEWAAGLLQQSVVPAAAAREPRDELRMALMGGLFIGVLLSPGLDPGAGFSSLGSLGEAMLPAVEHYLHGEPEPVEPGRAGRTVPPQRPGE